MEFKKSQKLIGIKFYNTERLKLEEARLILDYVIVSSEMEIINKPYNLIFNHNSRREEACLVILFGAIESKGKVYPVDFSFWISETMIEEGEEYLTKSEVSEKMIKRLVEKYSIKEIIFDAGFCVPDLLKAIKKLEINYICRFPKSRKVINNGKKTTIKEIFKSKANGSYYYYKNNGYLNNEFVEYADHEVQLVVVSNTRDKLDSKDYYCLITNNLEIKYPSVLKNYKIRGKIEDLFKKLKTYLGLTVCNRHNEDYIIDRINLAITGFVIVQEHSHKIKKTFHNTLKLIQASKQDYIRNTVKNTMLKLFLYTDNTAFEYYETP